MGNDVEEEYEVDGAMVFLLRTMRLFGVAPVRIRKFDSKTYIRLYRTFMYLGILFITCISISILLGALLDFSNNSPISTIVQILRIGFPIIISCFGAYGASNRFRRTMDYLKHLKKMQQNDNERNLKKDEKYKIIYIKFNLFLLLCGICLHFYISIMNTNGCYEMILLCLTFAEYVAYFIIFLLCNEFKLIVQMINTTLSVLNCELVGILEDLEHDSNNVNKGKSKERQAPLNVPFKSINKVIDNLAVIKFERSASALSKTNEMKIHRLLLQHIRICDIIATFNSSEGLCLLFVLTTYIITLTNIMYDLITTIHYIATIPLWKLYLINHCIWCTFIINTVVTVVDSCQRSTAEIDKTKGSISRLMGYVTWEWDPVKDDLEIYYNHLMLYNSNYSPIGVVTLNRSFILTVFGAIITFVLIYVDFNFRSGFMNL